MKTILPNKLKRFITVKVVCLLILTTTISASLTSITAFARSTSSSPPPGNSAINSKNPPPLIKISTILLTPENKKVPALTNAKGFVLYYYNLDTDPKNPNCSKVTKPICAQEWPPLLLPKGGSLKVPGLTGKLVVTQNANGQQITCNSHLLYSYTLDTKPLVATGNLRGNGNWHVAIPTKAIQQTKRSQSAGKSAIVPCGIIPYSKGQGR